jgi:hypothetical protein
MWWETQSARRWEEEQVEAVVKEVRRSARRWWETQSSARW